MQNLTVSPASTATRSAVVVRGLRKSCGQQVVLDGIDLDVAEGTMSRCWAQRLRQTLGISWCGGITLGRYFWARAQYDRGG